MNETPKVVVPIRGREMAELLKKPSTNRWTDAEAYAHLRLTFEQACMRHLELMEPFIVMRVEASGDVVEETKIMRQALRETIAQRYPYLLQ